MLRGKNRAASMPPQSNYSLASSKKNYNQLTEISFYLLVILVLIIIIGGIVLGCYLMKIFAEKCAKYNVLGENG